MKERAQSCESLGAKVLLLPTWGEETQSQMTRESFKVTRWDVAETWALSSVSLDPRAAISQGLQGPSMSPAGHWQILRKCHRPQQEVAQKVPSGVEILKAVEQGLPVTPGGEREVAGSWRKSNGRGLVLGEGPVGREGTDTAEVAVESHKPRGKPQLGWLGGLVMNIGPDLPTAHSGWSMQCSQGLSPEGLALEGQQPRVLHSWSVVLKRKGLGKGEQTPPGTPRSAPGMHLSW